MKTINLFLSFFVMFFGFSQEEHTKKVEQLISAYIDNVGGAEAWAEIKSFKLKMYAISGNQHLLVDHFMLKPNNYKMVFHYPDGDRILTYNGNSGQVKDRNGLSKMTEDMAYEMHEESDFFDELILFKERKYRVTFLLDTIISGVMYTKISLHKSKGDIQYYYLNQATKLVDIIEEFSYEKQYKGVLFKTILNEYHKVGDILFPMKLRLLANYNLWVSYEILDISLNYKLSKNDFILKN